MRRIELWIASIAVVAVGIWLYVKFGSGSEPEVPERLRPFQPSTEFVRPPVDPELSAEVPVPEGIDEVEAPRRSLPVEGLLLGKGCAPLGGYTIRLGSESVATDAAGGFHFPERQRPRSMELEVSRDGVNLVTWQRVLAGDIESAPRAAPAAEAELPAAIPDPFEASLPRRPERLVWTLNLLESSEAAPLPRSGDGPWLRIDHVFAEDWGQGGLVRIRGSSRFPDGASLAASLHFDGNRLFASLESIEVKSGSYECRVVCPEDYLFFAGTYEAHVSYGSVMQRPESWEAWAAERPDTDWPSLEVPEAVATIYVGDPKRAKEEDLSVARYYGVVLDEVQSLDRALKSRVEEVLDLARGWDPAALRGFLEEARYDHVVARTKSWEPSLLSRRQSARAAWFHTGIVKDGRLDAAAWRTFLDRDWRPRIQSLQKAHSERGQEKYSEAGSRLTGLLAALLEESYALSSFVVYTPDSPQDPNDVYPDEDREGDLVRLENVVRDNLEHLQRFRKLGSP